MSKIINLLAVGFFLMFLGILCVSYFKNMPNLMCTTKSNESSINININKKPMLKNTLLNKKQFDLQNSLKTSCTITFISAYFKVPSKHSEQEYEYWMSNLFSNKMCMVFYYEKENLPSSNNAFNLVEFLNNPAHENTLIHIPVDLGKVADTFFNKSEQFWDHQTKMDPELHLHKSYRLYWIWGLKSHFLQEVASSNPFQSEIFFWIDVGCIRDQKYTNKNWLTLQPPLKMKEVEGIFMVNNAPFTANHRKINKEGKLDWDFTNEYHLAGAIFGGSASSIARWTDLYKSTLQYYAEIDRFAGKDQNIFATMCLSHHNLCRFVDPDPSLNDIWFGMIPFITGELNRAPKEKLVLISTLLCNSFEDYSQGAIKLITSMRKHLDYNSMPEIYFDYAALELESNRIPEQQRLQVKEAGWEIVTVQRIAPRDEEGTFWRFRDQFSKLNLWNFESYDLVVYLDSDNYVIKDFSSLIKVGLYDESFLKIKFGATRDISAGEWLKTFNMGVFITIPSSAEARQLIQLKDDPSVQFHTTMAEQGFLNAVYENKWYDFGFEYNANLAAFSQKREFWDNIYQNISIIHYTMEKPWACGSEYQIVCSLWV